MPALSVCRLALGALALAAALGSLACTHGDDLDAVAVEPDDDPAPEGPEGGAMPDPDVPEDEEPLTRVEPTASPTARFVLRSDAELELVSVIDGQIEQAREVGRLSGKAYPETYAGLDAFDGGTGAALLVRTFEETEPTWDPHAGETTTQVVPRAEVLFRDIDDEVSGWSQAKARIVSLSDATRTALFRAPCEVEGLAPCLYRLPTDDTDAAAELVWSDASAVHMLPDGDAAIIRQGNSRLQLVRGLTGGPTTAQIVGHGYVRGVSGAAVLWRGTGGKPWSVFVTDLADPVPHDSWGRLRPVRGPPGPPTGHGREGRRANRPR